MTAFKFEGPTHIILPDQPQFIGYIAGVDRNSTSTPGFQLRTTSNATAHVKLWLSGEDLLRLDETGILLWQGEISQQGELISFSLNSDDIKALQIMQFMENPGHDALGVVALLDGGEHAVLVCTSGLSEAPAQLVSDGGPATTASRSLFEFSDRNGNTFAEITPTGDFHFGGKSLSGLFSVVDVDQIDRLAPLPRLAEMRDDFGNILENLRCWKGSNAIAPVPIGQVAENWVINDIDAFLSTVIADSDIQEMHLSTPYFVDAQVVHPHICQFHGSILGYQQLLLITGYQNTNDKYEDPFLYGIGSSGAFRLLNDVPQPLATPNTSFANNYNSDPVMFYDFHRGCLAFLWRNGATVDGFQLLLRRTFDGIHWTEPLIFYKKAAHSLILSPSIHYFPESDQYILYASVRPKGQRSAKFAWCLLGADGTFSDWQIIDTPFQVWHLEIKRAGRGFVGIFNDNYGTQQLYLGYSEDGYSWRFSQTPLLSGKIEPAYKASFSLSLTLGSTLTQAMLNVSVLWTTSDRAGLENNRQWRLRSGGFSTTVKRA
jgi:hypothetical protein